MLKPILIGAAVGLVAAFLLRRTDVKLAPEVATKTRNI